MKTLSIDLTKAPKKAIAELTYAIDELAQVTVKRDGTPTTMGRKIENNGGSDRLLKRYTGEIDTPVTANNAQMWIRTVEECERREMDVPVSACLKKLIATLRKQRNA